MSTLRIIIAADDMRAAVVANIEHEVTRAICPDRFKDATDLAAFAWAGPDEDDLTPNAAAGRLRAMRRGERLTLGNMAELAAALDIDPDSITRTCTPAARAALGADQ